MTARKQSDSQRCWERREWRIFSGFVHNATVASRSFSRAVIVVLRQSYRDV